MTRSMMPLFLLLIILVGTVRVTASTSACALSPLALKVTDPSNTVAYTVQCGVLFEVPSIQILELSGSKSYVVDWPRDGLENKRARLKAVIERSIVSWLAGRMRCKMQF